ncbi:MAG: hypothetical protein DRR16_06425 [Candidatus Parabeggiatoa sp. nov. 3]|nr:MAG: hypothetical protein DRR00_07445 [Gammaproteobacteria bacterium]RKZ87827.1 MAG: hypothetical protein DRR16_06425 [Gammaproteobacteria bacterium]
MLTSRSFTGRTRKGSPYKHNVGANLPPPWCEIIFLNLYYFFQTLCQITTAKLQNDRLLLI